MHYRAVGDLHLVTRCVLVMGRWQRQAAARSNRIESLLSPLARWIADCLLSGDDCSIFFSLFNKWAGVLHRPKTLLAFLSFLARCVAAVCEGLLLDMTAIRLSIYKPARTMMNSWLFAQVSRIPCVPVALRLFSSLPLCCYLHCSR